MAVEVKICGLSEPKTVVAAIDAGATFLGFNFFRRSPRFVTPDKAAELVRLAPRTVRTVGLFVDPKNRELDSILDIVRLDMVQLHGHESPDRVASIRRTYRTPVIKALGVSTYRDVMGAAAYGKSADWLLFDAKPPPDATRPGGNARAFDWSLLSGYSGGLPWLLAGGLTSKTVGPAIRASGAKAVDVSSGVESRPGVKSAAKIRAFINAVRAAS